jgi:hypothetical protein
MSEEDLKERSLEGHRLRDTVAAELELLNAPGGLLNTASDNSTLSRYGDVASRMPVWKDIREEFMGLQSDVATNGMAVVITAGPPGAGKTTAVEAVIPQPERCRRLDADIIKEMLIRRALADEIYIDLLARTLSDGETIKPLELASLVHSESVELLGYIRRYCMRRGENVVIEGRLPGQT